MHCRHLANSSNALYRVFIAPHSMPPATFGLLQPAQQSSKRTPLLSLITARGHRAAAYRSVKATEALNKIHTVDHAIASKYVHLVTRRDDRLPEPQSLYNIMRDLDTTTYHVVQVAPSSPSGYPIVKIASKQELRAAQQEKMKPKKTAEKTLKQIELGWAIGDNDLAHRLKKLAEFLEQGRRVEVLMANKKKSRKVTLQEAETLVRKVREVGSGISGTKEYAVMDGKLGGQAMLFFQGSRETAQNRKLGKPETLAADSQQIVEGRNSAAETHRQELDFSAAEDGPMPMAAAGAG